MTTAAEQSSSKQLAGEHWLARRLGHHGVSVVFAGVTDLDARRERMRETILKLGWQAIICGGHSSGKPRSYAQAFEQLYGQPLEPTSNTTKRAKHAHSR